MVGKRIIETRLTTSITIKKENAVAALEVMSRFAVDPRWLVYLPPTMSPTATSDREGLLEHPHEAFAAYRTGGVELVVCEESTHGSRAVVAVYQDSEVAMEPFGIESAAGGAIFTRTRTVSGSCEACTSETGHRAENGWQWQVRGYARCSEAPDLKGLSNAVDKTGRDRVSQSEAECQTLSFVRATCGRNRKQGETAHNNGQVIRRLNWVFPGNPR